MPLIFTRRADRIFRLALTSVLLTASLAAAAVTYYFTPQYTRVGYQPEQPVPFSHALHVGQLGLSCLYCHSHVEEAPHANVPATQTCLNCHSQIKKDSPLLSAVRASTASGNPVPWQRVHKLPDYAYFNHAIHIQRGVGCVSCHGPINEMKVVYHAQPLSMSWCLDCHRHPEHHLRPREEVTNLEWQPSGKSQQQLGLELKQQRGINAPQTCQGCHR